MSRRPPRRRYQLPDDDLNTALEGLLAGAQQTWGQVEGADYVRQLLVTSLNLVRDGCEEGDLKLLNNAMKELRHAFRVFAPFEGIRKVAVFGSARTDPAHPDWIQASDFARDIVANGWMVITGAGGGIMEAAQGGAGRERSFGVNIRLPFEQSANPVIADDHKLLTSKYFFTRKVSFVKQSHAVVLCPGGFGTHDEGFETLTLVQTGKSEILPIVFLDSPGGSYWRDWEEYVQSHLGARGLISPEDSNLFRVTDNSDAAVAELLGFYRNYHSSRYVRDRLVIRVAVAPDGDQLETLRAEFGDIAASGTIDVSGALPEENGDADGLSRVTLAFNRKSVGKLRRLINALNELVPAEAGVTAAGAPGEGPGAAPHQIVEQGENDDEE